MTDNSKHQQTTNDSTDEPSTEVYEALDEYSVELASTDPGAKYRYPEGISRVLIDGQIIALGEATHGSREFFRLKHRLLRYLILEHDVRVFAMEANFPETLAINEYVLYGKGDPKAALDGIYFWTWNVESVLELVEWLREFNESRPLDDRVRFYGFDAQYTSGAVERLENYLESVADPPDEVLDDLQRVDDGGTVPERDETDVATGHLVETLRDHLDEHREEYVSRNGEAAWQFAHQHVTVIEQATAYRRARKQLQSVEDEQPDDEETTEQLERVLRLRDSAMADNVDWLLNFEEPDHLVLWAHDAHVNRQKHSVRDTDAVETPMGGFLSARHGDEYVPVGFSFGRGSFQALSEVEQNDGETEYELQEQTVQGPVSGTFDATLDGLDYPVALVDVNAARNDERLTDLLCRPQPSFSAGATYDPERPEAYLTEYVYGEAFDAVCFVAETSRARPVERRTPD